jgi:hypothetical protein
MKNIYLSILLLAMGLLSSPLFSQTGSQTEKDTTLLGLPGDNLDLYAVLDLFQKSKTIEEFEKSLNLEKTGINNLDLDLDNKVDFIKVVTKQDKDDFTFVLQIAVNEKETQDVAVILVSKDENKKVTMQIVGDPDLYGKNFIVEPTTSVTPAVTPNPGYTGAEPVTVSVPATTTTVVVESAPIVQYVYSPAYVPYYPPYSYGYYPPYFAAFTVMAVGMYWGSHAYYHGGYGYHGNTTIIHNENNFNNYNNSRSRSNTVNNNMANGNYSRNNASTRQSGASASTRQSGGASASTRQSGGASASTRQSGGASASTRQSGGASASTRQSSGTSASSRPSTSSSANRATSSASRSNYSSSASRSTGSSSRSYSGGGGASRGGGGFSGGGGGGRRR